MCGVPDAQPLVEQLLNAGDAIVLFDGLDEVNEAALANENVQRHIEGKTVRAMDTVVPQSLYPVLEILNRIIESGAKL